MIASSYDVTIDGSKTCVISTVDEKRRAKALAYEAAFSEAEEKSVASRIFFTETETRSPMTGIRHLNRSM